MRITSTKQIPPTTPPTIAPVLGGVAFVGPVVVGVVDGGVVAAREHVAHTFKCSKYVNYTIILSSQNSSNADVTLGSCIGQRRCNLRCILEVGHIIEAAKTEQLTQPKSESEHNGLISFPILQWATGKAGNRKWDRNENGDFVPKNCRDRDDWDSSSVIITNRLMATI